MGFQGQGKITYYSFVDLMKWLLEYDTGNILHFLACKQLRMLSYFLSICSGITHVTSLVWLESPSYLKLGLLTRPIPELLDTDPNRGVF